MSHKKSTKLKVMVTRPLELAKDICEALQKRGMIPLALPCIQIKGVEITPRLIDTFKCFDEYCAVIFISRIAVVRTSKLLKDMHLPMPSNNVFAVGEQTAQQLNEEGVVKVLYPSRQSSGMALIDEKLLSHINDGEVLIVRGRGGNQKLADALQQQGVKVCYAEVYQRDKPPSEISLHHSQTPDIVFITSKETLHNFVQMVEQTSYDVLHDLQLIVGSQPIADLAKSLGFNKRAIVARSPADNDMLFTLDEMQEGVH